MILTGPNNHPNKKNIMGQHHDGWVDERYDFTFKDMINEK